MNAENRCQKYKRLQYLTENLIAHLINFVFLFKNVKEAQL